MGLVFVLSGMAGASAGNNENFTARIDVTRGPNGVIKIQPACRSTRSMIVTYSLSLNKKSKQGNSISRQSGKAVLKPDQEITLCLVSLNLPSDSKCIVQLEIAHEGRVISKKELLLNGSNISGSI